MSKDRRGLLKAEITSITLLLPLTILFKKKRRKKKKRGEKTQEKLQQTF